MNKREFSLRILRILAWQFVDSAQAGKAKRCRLIFWSMESACRAFDDCTLKLATEIVAEAINDQIAATVKKSGKPQLAALRELRALMKAPLSRREELAVLGLHFVSDADFYGLPEEGAQ